MSTTSLGALRRDPDSQAPTRRRLPAWAIPALILLGFAALFLAIFRDRLLPAEEVPVARVVAIEGERDPQASAPTAPGEGAVLFQASGWVEPDPYPVDATALVDGVVAEVLVLEGAKVEKGQLLATLIPEDFELELAAASKELERRKSAQEAHCAGVIRTTERMKALVAQKASAEAVRDAARDRLDRLERSGTRAVSERDIVDARLDLRRVEGLVTAAEARIQETAAELNQLAYETVAMTHMIDAGKVAVDQAQLALDRTRVTAPISGRVLRLMVHPGQKRMLNMDSQESSTIAELYDPEKMQVRVDVPLADAAQLRVGQAARIRCNLLPDQVFHGEVTRIVGEADLARNTLQAKVRILDPSDALRPEMISRVEFLDSGGERPAAAPAGELTLWVPREAVDDGSAWVVDPDSKRLESRQLTLANETRDGRVRVREGLRPGELVVLSPSGLRAGQRVNPEPTEP